MASHPEIMVSRLGLSNRSDRETERTRARRSDVKFCVLELKSVRIPRKFHKFESQKHFILQNNILEARMTLRVFSTMSFTRFELIPTPFR